MANRREALTGLAAIGAAVCLRSPVASAAVDLGPGWAERIVVYKRKRVLMLMRGGAAARTFRIALGREPRGTKLREGDGRTPEGSYRIDARNQDSQFYRAMHISYPNQADRQRARQMGVRPGGLIMIHGLDPGIRAKWHGDHWMFNWTRGCIAVTNEEMDVIWDAVALGTPIDIHP